MYVTYAKNKFPLKMMIYDDELANGYKQILPLLVKKKRKPYNHIGFTSAYVVRHVP